MKRGFKALAVLVAVAAAIAGPNAFAVCGEFGGFAIFQCADRAYFNPTPAGVGTVSAVWWQIGFGNNNLNNGLGELGTGTSGPTTFNGNDNGLFILDLVDARSSVGDNRIPLGAKCLRNNNWGNAGVDGCCDNDRGGPNPSNDDVVNPLYDVYYARNGYPGMPSDAWVADYPMGVLLREAGGHYFAVAFVSSMLRTGPTDVRMGYFNLKDINNGLVNPITSEMNIVPWQRVPGDRVTGDPSTNLVRVIGFVDPNDKLNSQRVLDLGWNAVVLYSDNATRPTTNPTMVAPGAGIADMPNLVRYVVEKQHIVNPANPYGSLLPNGWTPVTTVYPPATTGQVTVDPDTCVRLHSYFGKEPQVGPPYSVPNCRLGKCGDVGYDVVSAPACVGGPLVSDGRLDEVAATRAQGKVTVTFKTSNELNVSGFEIYAVTKKGTEKIGQRIPCNECTTGLGSTYTFTVENARLKGARSLEVVVLGTGAKFKVAIR